MSKFLIKIIPAIIFWGIFTFVILQIPYPENLTQANSIQVISFFMPLFLALSLTMNFFFKNILSSGSIALGLIFLLILKSLDSLNIVTGILTIIAVSLLVSYFRKPKRNNLTKTSKISKLHAMRKQNE